MKKICIILFVLVIGFLLEAQTYVMPYGPRYQSYLRNILSKGDTVVHISFKPFKIDSSDLKVFSTNVGYFVKSKIVKGFLTQPMVHIQKKDLEINLNLLGIYYKGHGTADTFSYFRNTRGFEIYGYLGKKLFYYTKFLENQAVFPGYLNQYINERVVVPGEGWWKSYGFYGRDYSYASGYLVFMPEKWIELRLGHYKNFLGSGYRSLLLSDNSFVYPQFNVILRKGHWQFVNIWTEFYSFRTRYYFYHYSKNATFNILGYSTKHAEVSLFQAVMWQTSDYRSYVHHFPVLFFFPVLAVPVYGLDSRHNALVGMDFNFRFKTYLFYGQMFIDKLNLGQPLQSSSNRYGWQVGLRSYDIFMNRVKWLNLQFLAEVNYVRPYTYQSEYWNQEYSNYNQPLAHPLGAGFIEKVFWLKLNFFNFSAQYKFSYALTASCKQNPCANAGTDVFSHEQPAFLTINPREFYDTKIIHNNFSIALNIHAPGMLQFFVSFDTRYFVRNSNKISNFVYFGIKSTIDNFYYDF